MIRVTLEPGRLRAAGHAGFAAPGRDVVCAAVSTLLCTLAQELSGRPDARVRLEPGLAEVECPPDEPALAFAAAGLRLLAAHCPRYVRVSGNRQ